jgi:hypothetical protein
MFVISLDPEEKILIVVQNNLLGHLIPVQIEEKILTVIQNNLLGVQVKKIQIQPLLVPQVVDNMDLEHQHMIAHKQATIDPNQEINNQEINGVLSQDLSPDLRALNLDHNLDLIGVLNQQAMVDQVVINKVQIDLVVLNLHHLINLVHQVLNQIMGKLRALNHHLEDKQQVHRQVMAPVTNLAMDLVGNQDQDMVQVVNLVMALAVTNPAMDLVVNQDQDMAPPNDLAAWEALEWVALGWTALAWITPEWITPEWITPEWITPEWITQEWITQEWTTQEWTAVTT